MTDTPNFQYNTPTVGADKDTWGGKLNANWNKIDADLKATDDKAGAANTKADQAQTDATAANTNANGRVSKSGDTMTGALNVETTTPQLLKIKRTDGDEGWLRIDDQNDNPLGLYRASQNGPEISAYAPNSNTFLGGLRLNISDNTVQLLNSFNTDTATSATQLITRKHGDARYVRQTNQPVFAENHNSDGSGYQRIGNTVRCWGTSTNTELDATGALVTFPVTFARPPIVTATVAEMEHRFTAVGSITTTTCRVRTSASNFATGNQPVSWQAIGEIAPA